MSFSLTPFKSRSRSSARSAKRFFAALAPVLAILAALQATPAQAVVLTWDKFGNGNYNDANNWFGGGPPTGADVVKFELGWGFPYTVYFPGNDIGLSNGGAGGGASIPNYQARLMLIRDNGLTFSGSTQSFKTASTITLTETGQTEGLRALTIGTSQGENASLSLSHSGFTGGGLASMTMAAATLGDVAGAAGGLNVNVGQFNVTGSDFTQTQFIVGNKGVGTVNVNNGAKVNVTGFNSRTSLAHYAGASGAMTISGTNSAWTSANELWVGEKGAGSLTVQNGGTLNTTATGGTASAILGTFAGGRGTGLVTGAGSTWNNSANLRVGNSGDGDLTVTNGGRFIHTGGANIEVGGGTGSSGAVAVTGAGSQFTTPGTIYVGTTGHGSFAVQNGGTLNAGAMLIRGLNTGSGDVLVSGAGSTMNVTNRLTIGLPEGGFTTAPTSLTINPGAKVTVNQDIDLNQNGKLKLNGGELSAKSIGSHLVLSQNYQGAFLWTGGTLHADFIGGSANNQAGKIAPGRAVFGNTLIDGNYTQGATSTMAIDIGGATPTSLFDNISLEGAANLGGLLELTIRNAFQAAPNQTFAILNSLSGIVGAFSNVANGARLDTANGLGSFQVNYGIGSTFDPNQIVLSNFQPAPGDFNGDGATNSADFDYWKANYGKNTSGQLGGAPMTGDDFLKWQQGLGRGGSAPPATASATRGVPEPASLALLGLATIGLTTIARRRRS